VAISSQLTHNHGEKMIDLGSSAGLDVFFALFMVGKTGKAIGADMTNSMLELTGKGELRKCSVRMLPPPYVFQMDKDSFSQVKANIISTPLPADSVDVITSGCVINLVPHSEKPRGFRLLKKGGRVAVSDILAKRDFLEGLRKDVGLYVGC
jgi:arsenite methyltransferase